MFQNPPLNVKIQDFKIQNIVGYYFVKIKNSIFCKNENDVILLNKKILEVIDFSQKKSENQNKKIALDRTENEENLKIQKS